MKGPLRRPYRRFAWATRRNRILPSFLIIGAQRAGTTSLFRYLGAHPEVAWPQASKDDAAWSKELHFFDDRFWRGVDWYRSFFPLATWRRVARFRGRDLIATEATPSYMFHPFVPERVAGVLPEAKLIAVLRNPVDRAYSHYQLMCRSGREDLSFEDALAAEEERLAAEEPKLADLRERSDRHRHFAYFSKGLYAEQLERWLAHFAREQILILRAEDFAARPADLYTKVVAFLGLQPNEPGEFRSFNRIPYPPMNPATRRELQERFREPNALLARLLGREFAWDAAEAGSTREASSA